MAITKEQWVDLINLKLTGGDAPAQIQNKYSLQEVEIYLSLAFSDVLRSAWEQSNDMVSDYIRTESFNVMEDLSRYERYIFVDREVLPLPENRGIIQIRQPKNPTMEFAISDISSSTVFAQLDVSMISNRVNCFVEGRKIFFDDKLPIEANVVLVKYITSFAGLQDDDIVIVPGGNNQLVIDTVYKLMLKQMDSVNQDNMVKKQV